MDLRIVHIGDLKGMCFNIPDYQRGYRWETKQVCELLDDLLEFDNSKNGAFYCLQPLVVVENNQKLLSDNKVFDVNLPPNYTHLYSKNGEHIFKTEHDLVNGLADSKITVCYPRCDTQPEKAGDIETLTQRYWEAMLSRIVIVGRAPKELTDLIGYNPVLNLGKDNCKEQVTDILANIQEYQELVNKNRETALIMGDWKNRIDIIVRWLEECGYFINVG